MLWSSPMSANTSLNIAILLLSATGIMRPDAAMSDRSPIVFIDTVLPPVFGPVMTSVSKSSPRRMSVATTVFGSISGCLAPLMSIMPSSLRIGSDAFIAYASCALAKMKFKAMAASYDFFVSS